MSFDVILASPPEFCKNALLWGLPVAHMAYKTCGAHLYRASMPGILRRGLMFLTNAKAGEEFDCDKVTYQILEECKKRSFSGVIADFEPPCPFADRLLPTLAFELKRRKLDLYVSEWAASFIKDCYVILTSAISGGTLLQRLRDAAKVFRYEHMVLDLEILNHDFLLPSTNGKGQKISKKRLDELIDHTNAKPLYSSELCCNYFSYKSPQGLHFVLFDNANSIKNKIELALKLGINKGIILYPESDDLIITTALSFMTAI